MTNTNWTRSLVGQLCRLVAAAVVIGITNTAYAWPADDWVINPGEHIEIFRGFYCFEEGRAGYREDVAFVKLSRNVLSAEVMISGFNMWYTREKNEHEVMNENVDAWVIGIGQVDPDSREIDRRYVHLKFRYAMMDEDTSGSDDYNKACIGYTVIARTE